MKQQQACTKNKNRLDVIIMLSEVNTHIKKGKEGHLPA